MPPPVIANGADAPVNRYSLEWSAAIPCDGVQHVDQPLNAPFMPMGGKLQIPNQQTSEKNAARFSPIDSAKAVHYYFQAIHELKLVAMKLQWIACASTFHEPKLVAI